MKHLGKLVGACQLYYKQSIFKKIQTKNGKSPKILKILKSFRLMCCIGKKCHF